MTDTNSQERLNKREELIQRGIEYFQGIKDFWENISEKPGKHLKSAIQQPGKHLKSAIQLLKNRDEAAILMVLSGTTIGLGMAKEVGIAPELFDALSTFGNQSPELLKGLLGDPEAIKTLANEFGADFMRILQYAGNQTHPEMTSTLYESLSMIKGATEQALIQLVKENLAESYKEFQEALYRTLEMFKAFGGNLQDLFNYAKETGIFQDLQNFLEQIAPTRDLPENFIRNINLLCTKFNIQLITIPKK